METYMEIAPSFTPQFLRDLLEILGNPSSVEFIVIGKEISEAAMKIGEMEGVKLEDRYIGGAPVHLEGNASIEKLSVVYERWYEYRKWEIERKKEFQARKIPRVGIKEIRWYKSEKDGGGYSIKFDEYNLEIDIAPEEDRIISDLIRCAKKHNMRIHINLRQG
ncbi:MAG: hypothetical protein H3Z53_01975 [archaeon]|nr:hypothetical protein [archaeon]